MEGMSAMSMEEAQELLAGRDLIAIGARGDDERRRRHGTRTTFVRVFEVHVDAVPRTFPATAEAGEIRVIGRPHSVDAAVAAVTRALTLAAGASVTAFSLADLVDLAAGRLPELFASLRAGGLELQLFTAADTREASDDFTLVYVFAPPTHAPSLTLLASLPARAPRVPSLAMQSFAASLFEREVHDLFGIVPDGHPDPRRLALHQFWPAGYHPLRRDATQERMARGRET